MTTDSISTNDTFHGEVQQGVDYECSPSDDDNDFERAFRIAAYVVIIIISLTGNLLIITVTRRTTRMRTVAFQFVVNMAIADLLTTLINMPESLAVEIRGSDEWLTGSVGRLLCNLLPFCQQVCMFCSVLSLLAIALDRCLAIAVPLKRLMTRKLAKVITFITWLIPCVASLPMWIANDVIQTEESHYCREVWPSPLDTVKASREYTIVLFVFFYALPLIVITTLYGSVIYKIWQRRVPGNVSFASYRMRMRSIRKALKMFIAVVVCFALCWLPYHIAFFLSYYNEEYHKCGIPVRLWFVGVFFGDAISALNPCIYMAFNKDYRIGAKRLVMFSPCCRKNSAHLLELATAGGIHCRAGANAHNMVTFCTHGSGLVIRGLPVQREQKIYHSVAKNDVYLVGYNRGFQD